MQFAVEIVNIGAMADPRPIVELATAAEEAGWEAMFLWDHLSVDPAFPGGDPWVVLAAVAARTRTLRVGTAVTPLPRHRPHMLARTLATLDLLSDGRVVLGAGLGAQAREYEAFGESPSQTLHASMVDEALEVLAGLWSGEPFSHVGEHYTVRDTSLHLSPVQRPRIPIWIGGESPPALRRAARWDGWVVPNVDTTGEMIRTPAELERLVHYVDAHRQTDASFDVAMTGQTSAGDAETPRNYAKVGVTWWLETLHGYRGSQADLLARVRAGPPR